MSTAGSTQEESTRAYQDGSVRDARTGNWVKGFSGNPSGKPKETPSLTRAVQKLLDQNPSEIDELARATVENAKAGNAVALKQVWDRLDGTVTERSETLVKQAEANEMSREAILIAADTIRRQEAENMASTMDVEAPLPSNGTVDMAQE